MRRTLIVSAVLFPAIVAACAWVFASGVLSNPPANTVRQGNEALEKEASEFGGTWSCWGANPEHSFVVRGKLGVRRAGAAIWMLECGADPHQCAICDNLLFVYAGIGPDEVHEYAGVHAIDLYTGNQLWKQLATALVGVDKSHVLVTVRNLDFNKESMEEVICYDQKDGRKIWSKSFKKIEGRCALRGNQLVLADVDTLTLLDAATGDMRWQVPSDIPFTVAQVLFDGESIVCVGTDSGKWKLRIFGAKDGALISKASGNERGVDLRSWVNEWQLAGSKLYGVASNELICVKLSSGEIEHKFEVTGDWPTLCSFPAITDEALIVTTSIGSLLLGRSDLRLRAELVHAVPYRGMLVHPPVVTDDVIFLPVATGIRVIRRDNIELVQEIKSGQVPILAGTFLLTWERRKKELGSSFEKWRITCSAFH